MAPSFRKSSELQYRQKPERTITAHYVSLRMSKLCASVIGPDCVWCELRLYSLCAASCSLHLTNDD